MAKIKKETLEAGVICLVNKINSTMPSSVYKFLIGGATGFATINAGGKLNDAIRLVSDENGLIDTEELRKVYKTAFQSSDGKLQVELFNRPDSILAMFVKPVTLNITYEDIDEIVKDMEKNSVVNEVSLSQQPDESKKPR